MSWRENACSSAAGWLAALRNSAELPHASEAVRFPFVQHFALELRRIHRLKSRFDGNFRGVPCRRPGHVERRHRTGAPGALAHVVAGGDRLGASLDVLDDGAASGM